MLKTEIAELMSKEGVMYDLAEKVEYNRNLNSEEKEMFEVADAWAREIGKTGNDEGRQIAQFIVKTVNEEVYNAPDELLDMLFERGSIGEFDDAEYETKVKNTLIAHEAAKGGTVDRSWLDFSQLRPFTKNRQVETDLSYADLRKNGFKSIATLTTYAKEALHNALFYDVFDVVDKAIVGGEQLITAGGALPTMAEMDALELYLTDRDPNAVAVCLTKYAQAIGRMDGYHQYMSNDMKNDFNRYGLVKLYGGMNIASISGAKKLANKLPIFPDQRIFGCAGKIGVLDMKGELHVYEDMDNSNEKVIIRVKDFTYNVGITNIENCAKMILTA